MQSHQTVFDFCIVGGGIIGLATALELHKRHPGSRTLLLEKEKDVGLHQTGHNSGVIHAGIYYKPGSLKAELCRRGAVATREFCIENDIPFDTCGKLVVATDDFEEERLRDLAQNAGKNAVEVEWVDAGTLRKLEPNLAGQAALLVTSSGIVDYGRIVRRMAELVRARGGVIETGARVEAIEESGGYVDIGADQRRWRARQVILCAGLQSDRLAHLAGIKLDYRIVPFRGEYFKLRPGLETIFSRMIYPVPDPALPFLGVHFTPTINGGMTAGPNAVLGFSREGYDTRAPNLTDVKGYLAFGGFWRAAVQNWRSGLDEMGSSFFKSRFVEKCRRYCPQIRSGDLLPMAPGIRAQAVMNDGTLAHDFLIERTQRILHVGSAPSPAATSSIPIAAMIADRLDNDAALPMAG